MCVGMSHCHMTQQIQLRQRRLTVSAKHKVFYCEKKHKSCTVTRYITRCTTLSTVVQGRITPEKIAARVSRWESRTVADLKLFSQLSGVIAENLNKTNIFLSCLLSHKNVHFEMFSNWHNKENVSKTFATHPIRVSQTLSLLLVNSSYNIIESIPCSKLLIHSVKRPKSASKRSFWSFRKASVTWITSG